MIRQLAQLRSEPTVTPTVWGFTPTELHDRYWAARGVQVVRQGEPLELTDKAELYLLTDPRTLVLFRTRPLLELLSWARPDLLYIRIRNLRDLGYRESALTGEGGQFLGFRRNYGGSDTRLARVAFTSDPGLARLWQLAADSRAGWRLLRSRTARTAREARTITAHSYDRSGAEEVAQFVRDIVQFWKYPASTIPDVRMIAPGVWAGPDAQVQPKVAFAGPVWIGAGRRLDHGLSVLGPSALWDEAASRPKPAQPIWDDLEPLPFSPLIAPRHQPAGRLYPKLKRVLDVVVSLLIILLTLPIYPLVMLAILLEDGRPFFFAHKRETIGGRTFGCIKFRSMKKNADRVKASLATANQSDGPQFFIAADPRLTKVGRFIRKCNIDELPQFFNVLRGEMSVVGPRPSPFLENQYCPPWREARLSVRPGVTGLWQVRRTRAPGLDFQEWIRYDLEYVEKMGWRIDAIILFKTFFVLLRGVFRS